jgi:transcriptional regulator with XRE-family HTH domain
MNTKSNTAKARYVNMSSRRPRSVTTLLAQMADLARGERIKALREERHLSQPAVLDLLEKRAGAKVVTLRGYQSWEAGGGIRWENTKVLADVFEVSPEWIMSGRETAELETPSPFAQADQVQDVRDEFRQDVDALREQMERMEQFMLRASADAKQERQDLAAQVQQVTELLAQVADLVAVLKDAEVIERSAAAAVRSLPEWPAGPSTQQPPAQAGRPGPETSGREDRRVRDRRQATG